MLLAAATLVGGCRTAPKLEPAPSAETIGMPQYSEVAVDDVRKVDVEANTRDWPGPARIAEQVTPVRITIENESSLPIRVSYDQFVLVAPDERLYAALPPFAVDGTVSDRVEIVQPEPVAAPTFSAYRYSVLRPYQPVYPSYSLYGAAVPVNAAYYGHHDYLVDRDLPTAEMLRRAIPEGVLEPGGTLEGWMYFEKLDSGVESVTLQAKLQSPALDQKYGTARIPFVTEG